jgi:hypothetical protein
MNDNPQACKVFYRPIEAAIRCAGLLKHEQQILRLTPAPPATLPEHLNLPRWSELRLYTERIYDGIFNHELPYGKDGITQHDETLWQSPQLTVRHLDLKKWMREQYPDLRPPFLFSKIERISHPFISADSGAALLVEIRALKAELTHTKQQFHALHEKHHGLMKRYEHLGDRHESVLTDRSETTYQNIIGAMLDLLLGQSPGGANYSSFRTQESVISALVANYGGIMGITDRTLQGKFALSRRRVRDQPPKVAT